MYPLPRAALPCAALRYPALQYAGLPYPAMPCKVHSACTTVPIALYLLSRLLLQYLLPYGLRMFLRSPLAQSPPCRGGVRLLALRVLVSVVRVRTCVCVCVCVRAPVLVCVVRVRVCTTGGVGLVIQVLKKCRSRLHIKLVQHLVPVQVIHLAPVALVHGVLALGGLPFVRSFVLFAYWRPETDKKTQWKEEVRV